MAAEAGSLQMQMNPYLRAASAASALLLIVVGLGFTRRWNWAIDLWPWPDGRLSYLFIGSVAAAAGAGLLWIALEGRPAMFQAFALDALLVSAAGAIHNYRLYDRRGEGALLAGAIVGAVASVGYLALFLWSRQFRFSDPRPTPRLLRISYAVFVVALVIVAILLLAKSPHVFPWPLKPETSVFIGWVLLASAVYYGYGVIRPNWDNAGPQLLAFLVYDLILLVPFIRHFADVQDAHRTSLIIYMVVIGYSALLALYYLAVDPITRLWSPQAAPAEEPSPRRV